LPIEVTLSVETINRLGQVAGMMKNLTHVVRALVQVHVMQPVSNASDRKIHQQTFKETMILDYKAQSDTSANCIKCMVLGLSIQRDFVKASHLVSLDQVNSLTLLGFNPSFKWNRKNGLLLFDTIDKAYNNMEITFRLNPATQLITVEVLYDDMLDKPLIPDFSLVEGYDRRSLRHKKNFRKRFATFRSINGQALHLPPLVFPSRRIILWAYRSARDLAIKSLRPHTCSDTSYPSEQTWTAMEELVASESKDNSENAFSMVVTALSDFGSESEINS